MSQLHEVRRSIFAKRVAQLCRNLAVRNVQAWLDQARDGEPGMLTRLGRVGADGALCVGLG